MALRSYCHYDHKLWSYNFYSTGHWCCIHSTYFYLWLTNGPNKLECLIPASLSSLVLC